jgi:hypothetical protein
MNSTKKNIRKTSGTLKKYKPGQLLTICKNVFRIVKNRSAFTDCYMCDLNFREQKDWCKYCLHNLHWCYFKLIKKHKG